MLLGREVDLFAALIVQIFRVTPGFLRRWFDHHGRPRILVLVERSLQSGGSSGCFAGASSKSQIYLHFEMGEQTLFE